MARMMVDMTESQWNDFHTLLMHLIEDHEKSDCGNHITQRQQVAFMHFIQHYATSKREISTFAD